MARTLARRRARFLDLLRKRGNLSEAARGSGLDCAHALRLRESDAGFARAWDEAVAEAVDALEAEAWRRVVEGEECPVFYKGPQVGTRRRRSDPLLKFLLNGYRPERFGPRQPAPMLEMEEPEVELVFGELVTPPGADGTAPGEDCTVDGKPIRYEKIEAEDFAARRVVTVGFRPVDNALSALWEEKVREWLGLQQAAREGWDGFYSSRMSEIAIAKRLGRPPPPLPTRPPELTPEDDS